LLFLHGTLNENMMTVYTVQKKHERTCKVRHLKFAFYVIFKLLKED